MAAKKLMQALVYDAIVDGNIGLKHVELPVPTPSKDEVLIKVEAVSVNPFDWKAHKLRSVLRPFLSKISHTIPCMDVAGEVIEVGSQAKKFKVGDKVVAILNIYVGGGLAEYAVAKESVTVCRPAEVSAAEGACLPIAGITAYVALTQYVGLKLDGSDSQKNILVTAASGGVGQFAVQLAKLGNAHVTATCGARNIDLVKSLGADEVLDYKTEEGACLKSPSGRKYDAVIQCGPAIPWATFDANLAEAGFVVDLSPGASAMWTCAVKKITLSKKKLMMFVYVPKDDVCLKKLVGLVKEGKLKTIIDSKWGLSRAEEAWSKSISGHATGKIIVEP